MRRRGAVAAIVLVALLGVACGGDDGGDAGVGDGAAGGGESATLTAAEFTWEPADLSAAAGGSIEVVNEDDAKHNLTVEEAGIDEDVDPNESVTVDLAGLDAGSYDFVCEYHPDTMTGTLEVTG